MWRNGKVLSTSVLLLSVAACGGQTAQTGRNSTTSSQAPPPTAVSTPPPPSPSGPPQSRPTQGVPPGDRAPAPGQIDASALPADYPHDVALADGGSTVVVQAEEGGCDHLSAAPGEQAADHVVVVVTLTRAPHGKMCPMHVKEQPLPVRLAEPLGARKLVLRPGP